MLIDKTQDLKKEYEKELETEKEKTMPDTLEKLVKVSLEEETVTNINQIAETLRKYHQEIINQRGKVRVRKR